MNGSVQPSIANALSHRERAGVRAGMQQGLNRYP